MMTASRAVMEEGRMAGWAPKIELAAKRFTPVEWAAIYACVATMHVDVSRLAEHMPELREEAGLLASILQKLKQQGPACGVL